MRLLLDEFGLSILEGISGLLILIIIYYLFGQVASGNPVIFESLEVFINALAGGV
ncbi:hypothetical protein [Massilimicrobiota timonensis]|uniref:hypothetical protein n=1 Tax=Massilimicrobiota timonensis TaxID=1776392 RepID=UPI0013ECCE47|nr:hypothetical protein [Massilimicrobiota timonensis]